MAVEFVATVDESGADYGNLAAAEAGLQNVLNASDTLVFSISAVGGGGAPTAGTSVTGVSSGATGVIVLVNVAQTQCWIKTIASGPFTSGEVVDDDGDASISVTLSDAGDTPIAGIEFQSSEDNVGIAEFIGWTTAAANFIRVFTPEADRHNGTFQSSKPRHSVLDAIALDIKEDFMRFEGLQIETVSPTANNRHAAFIHLLTDSSNDIRFEDCIFKGHNDGTFGEQEGIRKNDAIFVALTLINCLFFNFSVTATAAVPLVLAGEGTYDVYSCTLIGGEFGYAANVTGTHTVKNCYVGGSSTLDYDPDIDTLVTCASSDTSGSAGLQSIAVDANTFVNVGAGTEDFHLPVGSPLIGTGTDTSSEGAPLNFTTDIDGDLRSVPWSVGIDQGPPLADLVIEICEGHLVFRGPADPTKIRIDTWPGTPNFQGHAPTLDLVYGIPVGQLAFAGQVPLSLAGAAEIPVPVGALVLTGQTPSLDFGLHPAAGALVFAGQAPALSFVIDVPVGALVLAGQQETLGFAVNPGLGTLVFAGQTPTRVEAHLKAIPVGTLVFTGQQGTLDFGLHPAAGALILQGLAPASEITVRRDMGVGALILTGQTPSLGFELHTGVGALVFAGLAPTTDVTVLRAVPAGALVFTGQGETLGFELHPGVGALVFAGQAPTRFVVELRSPGVGALVFGGLAPLRIIGINRAPGAGGLVLAGQTPVRFVVELRSPGAGTLVFAGQAPGLGFELHPGAGVLVFAGLAPLADITVLRAMPVGALVLTGQGTALGFELHPGVGALVLAGQAPLAFRQRVFAPGAGSLVFAGQTPLRLIDDLTPVPAGALVFAGQAPVAFVQRFIPVPAGALVFTGELQIVIAGTLRLPGAGALVLAGQTPVRFVEERRAPAAGTLLLAGQTPTLGFELHPGVGALLLGGQAPLRLVDDPTPVPPGTLVFAGLSPALAFTISVPVGALVFAGQLPGIFTTVLRSIPVGALVFAGQQPATNWGVEVQTGALVFAGQTPIRRATVTIGVPVGALVFAGLLPDVIESAGSVIRAPGAGALVFAGQAPTLEESSRRDMGAGALVFQGLAPTLDFSLTIPVPVGALLFVGQAETVEITHLRTPGAGTLVLAGQLYSLPPSAGPGLGALVFAGLVPTILQPRTAPMGVADLRFTGHAPNIPTSDSVQMLPGPMALAGNQPYIGHTYFPAAGTLLFTGQVATITGTQVTPPGQLVFQGHAPFLALSSPAAGVGVGGLVLQGLLPTISAGGSVGGTITIAVPVGACAFTGHVARASVFTSDLLNPPNKQTLCIRRERQGTFITDELGWIFTHMIQLDLETGIGLDGLATLQGNDPQIEMQFSDDNARTWSNMRATSGGKIGKFRTRAIWRRLGRSRKRLYRIRLCDPVKWAIVDAYARFTKGTS